jgi:hypothetical protein
VSSLIERSRLQAEKNEADRAAYEAKRREEERTEAMHLTMRMLREWGVMVAEMSPLPDHDWAGVVEVDGLLFRGSSSRYSAGGLRRLMRCPDCGEWAASEALGLADLARNVEQEQTGERWKNGSPVWIDREYHGECPGLPRPARPAPPAPTLAEQLSALIRQIAAEEVESRLPGQI